MKTRLKRSAILLLLFVFTAAHPITALCQDAEKQKIIDVIQAELDYWYKKDKEKWASCVVQSNEVVLTAVSSQFYYSVQRFDSLVAQREKYFSTPVDPNVKRITKGDFKVNIKGNIAIVDLIQRGEDFQGPYASEQTILMEKQGKSWKILRQTGINKGSYELNDSNIEASLNTQGYRLMQLKKIDEAIQVFTLNTQLYPKAFNTWDSLAEAYMEKGERQIAIAFYKKSLELNPQNDNGKKMIEKLTQNQ